MKMRESYFSSIAPDTVVLTDKRVVIIHNSFWGLYLGINILSPTRVSSVMLNNIMGTTNANGKILATVQIRIRGSGEESESSESGWHIEGLRIAPAHKLSSMIEESIQTGSTTPLEISLDLAKSLIDEGKSSMIWLGSEPTEYVSYILGIPVNKITRVNPIDISSMDRAGLADFQGKIFVCYGGNVSSQIARLLKDDYEIKSFVLSGGLASAINSIKRDNKVSGEK